jgi:hypothetical protein
VPDGQGALSVRFTFKFPSARNLLLRFSATPDLRTVWSPRFDLPQEQKHFSFEVGRAYCLARHAGRPWSVIVGSPRPPEGEDQSFLVAKVQGSSTAVLECRLQLEAGMSSSIDLVICGSHQSEQLTRATFEALTDVEALWSSKQDRYKSLLSTSRLQVPDESVTRAWDWLKCNNDWLIRDVPDVGRGLGAGVDEYPWWFGCDTAYAALGCLVLGQHQTAIETIDLVRHLSEKANGRTGRVIHEATTSGEIVHPGNTQETPHFASAVWETFRWTGDAQFLRRNYDFCRRGVLEWLFRERCTVPDLLPRGPGIIEILGLDLQCVDVAAHTVSGLNALAGMAGVLGDARTTEKAASLASQVAAQLEAAFWLEAEGLYGDLLATPRQLLERMAVWKEQALQRCDESARELLSALQILEDEARQEPDPDERRAWLLGNWTVIAPLEAHITGTGRSARVLERVGSQEFVGPRGMYLRSVDHQHAMSINTGVLASAQVDHGRPDVALSLVKSLTSTLEVHMPGAISEMSPDYGCFVQAWSGYAVAWPVVSGMFGIRPDAYRKHLQIDPCFPQQWDRATLSKVLIGSASFDLDWDGSRVLARCSERWWTISSADHDVRLEFR